MKSFRQSILDDRVEEFVNNFLKGQFSNEKKIPGWVLDAMEAAKIKIDIKFDC